MRRGCSRALRSVLGFFRRCFMATSSSSTEEKKVKVKAIVTVKLTITGFFENFGINRGIDVVSDLLGKSLLLELVSSELDPSSGLEKKTVKGDADKESQDGNDVKYEGDLEVPEDFGEVGGILVVNEHSNEMFIESIVLYGFPSYPNGLTITCNSWVHSKHDNTEKRIFFTNKVEKSYLPSETPQGLKRFREKELLLIQGDGQGERKTYDRIYDYDVYNDIGDPDSDIELKRPVLGGKDRPYPRRCRTGRPPCKTDSLSESTSSNIYVPRDESFAEIKDITFSFKIVYSVLHALIPALHTAIIDSNLGFPLFSSIDDLYNEGFNLPVLKNQTFLNSVLPRLVKLIDDVKDGVLSFETPALIEKDKFAWFRDEEFSRQTLAGINPYAIKLVTEWPLKSKLDPKLYGSPESAISIEIIEREIRGYMSLEEAIEQKKLFIIDYNDLLLPYVSKVRLLEGTTLYGSRTLFFLTEDSTLKVLAIELTRPLSDYKPQWKRVFTPGCDATSSWLWRLAKAHVLAHDSSFHQLVSHWLRTHCCTEPYIIATNRQLSQMHPIYRLLDPHFRYTMEINALAREGLINADGVIESSFSLQKYSMELSSVAYDQDWRFDLEGLPADLINRGLAIEDPTAPHGLKLSIQDYPFANDGLLLWDAIKEWITTYVNHYYSDPNSIQSDQELQTWWTEIRTKGHADKKDQPWWPVLKTPQGLIGILTTMVWVASGHHAAVNFGQYHYAGYFPNRPTIARNKMPNEDSTEEDWENFMHKPENALLQTFPTQIQATKVMAVLNVLSEHSPDEEYLGAVSEMAWGEDVDIKAAFQRFNGRLKEIEVIIDGRNADENLKNRSGAGVVSYELLKPFSEPGVTGKGVPCSISI